MDLITTHINADFDALGSLVAAKKLYPNARLLLPGSPEEAVREFLSLAKEAVVVESEKECRFDDVSRLIIVDTRHRPRIGEAAKLLDKGAEVHIYDHHPRMKDDIVADEDVYEEVGATITILADIIRKKHIRLSALEATIMLLGIYEETGSLTYRATTRLDVDIVSFLLSQGASLAVVSSYLNREISKEGLSLLTRLINSTERISVKGISVSIIEIDSDSYVSELGSLIQKLLDIENINVLFVLIKTSRGRVDIIGRSKLPAVDVNKVLSHFGGGGHPAAAAAKVRNADIGAVKNKLVATLKNLIKIRIYAEDIMSKDVKVLSADNKIDKARKVLIKSKLGGLPVSDKSGRIVGIITLDGLNKAVKQGFGHSRIKGYMSTNIITVKPKTPLHAIQKIMLEKDAGILPVVKGRNVAGVINRTDVFMKLYGSMLAKPQEVEKKIILNLSKKMSSLLPEDILRLLKKIGKDAKSLNYSAFIVGGLVRDLLLGVKNLDLDIVVEGDAIKFGHILAKDLNAALVVHKRFGTCSVITKNKLKIDLATARKEIYERPAALPTVEFSSLKDDLVRRDFTINAMAVSLNKESFGQLIDFFAGERDLARGVIKVMHNASFIDDPTRIFRAVRFETRFGFSIDKGTEELIKHAIKKEMFQRIEPQRIRDELILILKEEDPCKAIKRMSQLDELRFLHPKIIFDKRAVKLYNSINRACDRYDGSKFKKRAIDRWLIYLMALFDPLSYNDTSFICSRFVFRRSETIRLLSCKESADKVIGMLNTTSPVLPSRIYKLLEPLSFEVILFIMAKAQSKRVSARIEDFFSKLNGTRIKIKGEDIAKLGLKPCPRYKEILDKVLFAKIDGRIRSREEEISYAAGLVKKVCI